MKKHLLLLAVIVLAMANGAYAQETEIYYPTFQYDTNKGFTKHNITVGTGVDETKLWKRSTTKLPDANELGYIRSGAQTSLSTTGYGGNGSAYTPTLTFAVVDAVDLSIYSALAELKVTFFNQAQYALGNFSEFTVLATDAYSGDPTTTVWTDVTSRLDQLDQDVDYDGLWTKSTLILNDWKDATSFVLAFKYEVKNSGTVQNDVDLPNVDRPGLWRVCEVRFSGTDTPTAVEGIEIEGALFSPNPAASVINVHEKVTNLVIYNINGAQIKAVNNVNGTVDVSELQQGVYFLQMKLDSGVVKTAKMVKQ